MAYVLFQVQPAAKQQEYVPIWTTGGAETSVEFDI